jgi:hypothetical protein
MLMKEWMRFFTEMHRRNVYRVIVIYCAVAGILIQIASQVFPFFEIPSWAVRVVILLLVLGFPIATVLAWTYEVTPEGIKRTDDARIAKADPCKTGRKRRKIASATRLWDLAGLLFDRKTRAQVYDPVINEIREDFLLARRNCRSRANRNWVKACFAIRGSLAFLRCLRISILRPVIALIPSKLKQFWKLFS